MSGFKYITHARTLDELRQEFLSDVKRRLGSLDAQMRFVKGSATKLAQIGYAQRELEDLARFWQEVELRGAKKKASASASASDVPAAPETTS